MKICKSDILEKNSKDLKNKIQLKFQSVVIVKKLLVNFIPNFQFRANFVEKRFAKIAINLMQPKMFSYKKLMKLEKITLKTL